jgi:hypothetical protein
MRLPVLAEKLDLLTHYFSDVRVFVYGSCVQPRSEGDKDIDLVMVSPSFAGVVGVKRKQLVCRLLGTPSLGVDPICLTPKELERLSTSKSQYALFLKDQMLEIGETAEDD